MASKTDVTFQEDWDQFWTRETGKDKGRISWSKKRVLRVIQPFLRPAKHVLDAGCGTGFFTRYFCDQGKETTGLDYSAQALEIADRLTGGRGELVKADLLAPDLGNRFPQKFDLIFSDGLFEHFSPAQQDVILANFHHMLKPDGVAITFVPNRWSPWQLIRPWYMPGIEEDPFTQHTLLSLHERNGWRLLERGGINVVPFPLSPDRLVGPVFGMLLYAVARNPRYARTNNESEA
jgi:SAM-dependent methyltransferase